MEKPNDHPMDKELMNYLVKYVTGKSFLPKHTVMDVDDVYGITVFSPTQILESTKGAKKNTRFLITQKMDKCRIFASKEALGAWKPIPKIKSIFYANKTHIGNIKVSCYYYYNINDGRRKSSSRMTKSKWQMREYYLASKYLPQNKVERKDVLLTMMIKNNEPKHNNNNDEDMQIMQSLQGLQLQDS